MIIILVIIIISCCSFSISLGGGGYYYYTQSTPKSSTTKPATSNITASTPSNTSASAPSNAPAAISSIDAEKDLKDPKDTQEKGKYKIHDAEGIKTGKFNNISNATFGLSSDSTRWSLTIILKYDNLNAGFQAIVGNMYNKEVTNGWGLWINPEKLLHLRINDKTWNLKDLGALIPSNPYKIVLSYSYRTGYTFNSTNLKYFTEDGKKKEVENNDADAALAAVADNNPFALLNAIVDRVGSSGNKGITSSFVEDTTKLISDKGFISVGGWWENNNNEKFQGNINYLEFYKIM